MASLVLRSLLLATFVYSYLVSSTWYQLVPVWNTALPAESTHCSGVENSQQSRKKADAEFHSCPSSLLSWKQLHVRSNCEPAEQPESLSETLQFSYEKHDLLWASWVLINALTILDLVLSRRTKPWRFMLRILYRISRSNVKWASLWFIWFISLDFGLQPLTDRVEQCVRYLALTDCGRVLQQVWMLIQHHPVWCCLNFAMYNLVIGSILHRLMPRSDNRNSSNDGRIRNDASAPSRWTLLLELIFRPVSFATAQNLNDVDFELDDSMDLLIERLALPNLWLTPIVPTDYLKYLPVWQYGNGWKKECLDASAVQLPVEQMMDNVTNQENDVLAPRVVPSNSDYRHPLGMIPSSECAICLDKYRCSVYLCGLPCGHHFHHDCIMIWLTRDNHHCPICRWPAYRSKSASIV